VSATSERDRAADLAKADPVSAARIARDIGDPWFRAQALSWVLRFSHDDVKNIASDAADSAARCVDDYKRSAVRAWEIAALAERGMADEACESLKEALAVAWNAEPPASRCESLFLLLQAAFSIKSEEARKVFDLLRSSGSQDDAHWRCRRAIRDAEKIFAGEARPRPFFW